MPTGGMGGGKPALPEYTSAFGSCEGMSWVGKPKTREKAARGFVVEETRLGELVASPRPPSNAHPSSDECVAEAAAGE